MSASPGEYGSWSQQQLITRISELEAQLRAHNASVSPPTPLDKPPTIISEDVTNESIPIPYRKAPKQPPKAFDASKYSSRLVAFKFAYLGQKYNGFEHHKNNKTPLPTIEEELWKALVKTRLITPTPTGTSGDYARMDNKKFAAWDREGADVNWDGCEYSKCGRTDRGVSAFGQVIGVRVRSNRPLPKRESESPRLQGTQEEEELPADAGAESSPFAVESEQANEKPFDDEKDEISYIQLLNRVLPPDIRIYAWCPNPPPDFSARFSCKERRYKYFFTNPCFTPLPSTSGVYTPFASSDGSSSMREGWLDIEAMKKGCQELIGLHDFRNFCKIDASKQLTNFQRRIFHADIEEVSALSVPSFLSHSALQNPGGSEQPKMYAFVLHGSAFLWHQVRSIVAILFLLGQGLESPSIIPQLLNISSNPTRPKYEMASDAPLVLWDCIFPNPEDVQSTDERENGYEDALNWIYVGDEGGTETKGKFGSNLRLGKWGRGGVMDDLWEVWRGRKMEETLGALLMDAVAAQGQSSPAALEAGNVSNAQGKAATVRVFDGGDIARAKGNYIPVLNRERQEPVEVVNERYARKKGLDPAKALAKADDGGDE